MIPWKKTAETTVYNGFRKVVQKVFSSPDGRQYHFDVKAETDVVCMFALTTNQEVILIRQFRPGPERYLLELPGGMIDEGETPEIAMLREFKEETGYEPASWKALHSTIACPYSTRTKYNYLLQECIKREEVDIAAHEQTEVVLLNKVEFTKRLYAGEFPESDTAFLGLAAL
jgi:ADP-ribose pyrophosphatase